MVQQVGHGGLIPSSIGKFGHISYGSEFVGRIHYPVSNRDACNKFVDTDFSNDMLFDEPDDLDTILLVEHGGCPQVQKVKNAETMGFKSAILIDDEAEDEMELLRTGYEG